MCPEISKHPIKIILKQRENNRTKMPQLQSRQSTLNNFIPFVLQKCYLLKNVVSTRKEKYIISTIQWH